MLIWPEFASNIESALCLGGKSEKVNSSDRENSRRGLPVPWTISSELKHHADHGRDRDVDNRVQLPLPVAEPQDHRKKDALPVEQIEDLPRRGKRIGVEERNPCHRQSRSRDEGKGCGAKPLKDPLHHRGVLESMQNPCNDEDDDNGREHKSQGRRNAPRNTGNGVADIGSHVDA